MNTYGGTTRLHRLQAGDALDRRRMEELFLQAGRRANEIFDRNIGNKQFGRTSFVEDAIQEFWYNKDEDANYKLPVAPGNLPGTALPILNDDSFVFGELVWSLRASVPTAQIGHMLVAWPVFDYQALWSAEDVALRSSEYYNDTIVSGQPVYSFWLPFSGDSVLSLGGRCNFIGGNGRMLAGVMVHSIGSFTVHNVQLAIRTRNR